MDVRRNFSKTQQKRQTLERESIKEKLVKAIFPLLFFTLISCVFYFKFVLWGYHYIAADFLDWYYPWRYTLVRHHNRNTYIYNKDLGDSLFMFAPINKKYNQALKRGKICLWIPDNIMGYPAYASHNTAFFYPPKLFFNYFFDFLTARDLLAIFQLTLLGILMYGYLRNLNFSLFLSMLGGTLWMLNGHIATRVEFGTDTYPLAYLPLILWMIDKIFQHKHLNKKDVKYGVILSIGVCLCIISGHWQFVFYTFIMGTSYFLFRVITGYINKDQFLIKKVLMVIFFVILGGIASSIQSIPTLELAQNTHRPPATSISELKRTTPHFKLKHIITLFIPEMYGNPTHHFYFSDYKSSNRGNRSYFELSAYIGILPILFAFFSISNLFKNYDQKNLNQFYTLLSTISMLMAMGTPIYGILFYTFPPIRYMTISRILCLFVFSTIMLSLMGIEIFEKNITPKNNRFILFSLILLLILGGILHTTIYNVSHKTPLFWKIMEYYWEKGCIDLPNNFASRKAFVDEMLTRIYNFYKWTNLQLTAPLFIGFAGLLLLYLKNKSKISKRIFYISLFLLILIDIFPIGLRYNPAFPKNSILPKTPALQYIKKDKGIFRISGWHRYPHPNTLSLYDLTEINGYFSFLPYRVRDFFFFLNKGKSMNAILPTLLDSNQMNLNICKMLNIKYFYTRPFDSSPPLPLKKVYSKDWNIYQVKGGNSRAFLVGKWEKKTPGEIINEIFSPKFNPSEKAFIENPPPIPPTNGKGYILFQHYESERITVVTKTESPMLLVVSDTYYPGWKGYIDGHPTNIYITNFFLKGIFVPKGIHTITLIYDPTSLKIGKTLSTIALLTMILIISYPKLFCKGNLF